jgi:Flp pilus assembly protein TadD
MFGEEALWYQKRGAARVALNRLEEAELDVQRASSGEARPWVQGRAYAELGKIADLRRNRTAARTHFQRALALAQQDNDPIGAESARRWIGTAYSR